MSLQLSPVRAPYELLIAPDMTCSNQANVKLPPTAINTAALWETKRYRADIQTFSLGAKFRQYCGVFGPFCPYCEGSTFCSMHVSYSSFNCVQCLLWFLQCTVTMRGEWLKLLYICTFQRTFQNLQFGLGGQNKGGKFYAEVLVVETCDGPTGIKRE